MVMDGDAVIVTLWPDLAHLGVKLAERNVRLFTTHAAAAYPASTAKCSLTIAGGELHREPRVN